MAICVRNRNLLCKHIKLSKILTSAVAYLCTHHTCKTPIFISINSHTCNGHCRFIYTLLTDSWVGRNDVLSSCLSNCTCTMSFSTTGRYMYFHPTMQFTCTLVMHHATSHDTSFNRQHSPKTTRRVTFHMKPQDHQKITNMIGYNLSLLSGTTDQPSPHHHLCILCICNNPPH